MDSSNGVSRPRICFGCGQLRHFRKECPYGKPKLVIREHSEGSQSPSSFQEVKSQISSELIIEPLETKCSICGMIGHSSQYSCSLWWDMKI